jgi:translation initiation factor IF-2
MDMAPKTPMAMAPKTQTEASAKPPMDMAPKPALKPNAPIVEAASDPIAGPTTVEERVSVAPPKIKSTTLPSGQEKAIGPGAVTTETSHPETLPLSGDNVPSMMVMTNPEPNAATAPVAGGAEANVKAAAAEPEAPAPAPAAKPKPKPKTLSADAAESASAASVPHVVKPKPKPKEPEEVLPWLRPRPY